MLFKLICNPVSRSGRGRKLWPVWEAGLREAGSPYEIAVTSGPGDAIRIARESCGPQTLVAVGGDGTINEVLDGIMLSGNPELRLGILYSGTSPDFCRFHGIPTTPCDALACLLQGRVKRVDVAAIDYSSEDGTRKSAHFGCGCNIGLGAAVATFANRARRRLGDALGTGLGLFLAILRNRPMNLDLSIDGAGEALENVNHLFILKSPFIASGLKLDADLSPDNGKLVLACIRNQSRLGLCRLLPGFYTGRAAASEKIMMQACTNLAIRAPNRCAIEYDGDPRGFLPANLRLLPKALNLVVPSHD